MERQVIDSIQIIQIVKWFLLFLSCWTLAPEKDKFIAYVAFCGLLILISYFIVGMIRLAFKILRVMVE